MNAVESTPKIGRWRRIRKWATRFGLLILVILALAAGGVYWHSARAESDLRQAVSETDALDPDWREAHQNAIRSLTAHENEIQQLRAFWKNLPENFDDKVLVLPVSSPQLKLSQIARDKLDDQLKPIAGVLPELRRNAISDEKKLRLSLGPFRKTPVTQIHSRLLRVFHADCLTLIESGDWPSALQSWQAYWKITCAIGDDPLKASQIECNQDQFFGLDLVERLLGQFELSQSVLLELQNELTNESQKNRLLIAVRCDRAETFEMFELMRANGLTGLKQVVHLLELVVRHQMPISDALENMPGNFPSQQALALRMGNRLAEIVRLPPERWPEPIASLSAEILKRPTIAAEAVIPTARVATLFGSNIAKLRCVACALAAERFRIANGRWPESLEDLAKAEFLTAVPLDPFDAKPIRYRRTDNGIVIYSIGRDAADDGGILDRANPYRTGTDCGIRLWDVARRRQPPPPENKDKPN